MNDAPVVFNGRVIPKQFEQFKHNEELYEIMNLCFECGGDAWIVQNDGTYCILCGSTKEHSDEMIAEYLKQGDQKSTELKKPNRQRVQVI